jgi:4-hydroxythreonine-4-phosphate dehydrogenase
MTGSQPAAAAPVILVTCGDPSGIGPEVAAAAWSAPEAHARARLRIVADPALIAEAVASLPAPRGRNIAVIEPDDPRPSDAGTLLVIPLPGKPAAAVPRGRPTAAGGHAAVAALDTAFRLVGTGQARAIVTGPLHKEALHAAGYDVPGHTEWLARACGLPDTAASMMLWLPPTPSTPNADGLGVVHVTLHEPLRAAVGHLTTEGIVHAGRRLDGLLAALLGHRPRIGVAALNPHAGEGGLFGDEESRIIAPAVAALAAEGVDAIGPLPADTLFLRASRGEFSGVVAMYHDQGHIPVKLLGMHRAVNITLGLPLVRTSVAHGTAFDIVGTASADPASMLSAIDAAARLVATGWPPVALMAAAARSGSR